MKKNMKKLVSLLLMAMLVLGLTACGSKEESQTTVVESQDAEAVSTFFVAVLTELPEEVIQELLAAKDDELQMQIDYTGLQIHVDAFRDICNSYYNDKEVYGEYISTEDFNLKGDEKEATHTTNLKFEEHDATLTLVFDENGVVTSASIDPVYSLGEILQKAGLNTVIGMGTVFIVLIFISGIIALLPKVTGLIEKTGKKEVVEIPAKAEPAPVAAPAAEELVDDLELVAVISAAIAAYTGTSSDGFVVRSIKRSKTNKWKKA